MVHLAECGDEALELDEDLDITDRDRLDLALKGAGADAICHLAAQAAVGRSWEDPHGTFTVNALGTLNLCSAAVEAQPRPRLLLVSSAEVYGSVRPEDMPIGEGQPLAPSAPYATSKQRPKWSGCKPGWAKAWRSCWRGPSTTSGLGRGLVSWCPTSPPRSSVRPGASWTGSPRATRARDAI